MFEEMNPMAKSTAWMEITIIVLVAFLIGFIISWLYWMWKRKSEREALLLEIENAKKGAAVTKDDCCAELETLKTSYKKLEDELMLAKGELATMAADKKDDCCAELETLKEEYKKAQNDLILAKGELTALATAAQKSDDNCCEELDKLKAEYGILDKELELKSFKLEELQGVFQVIFDHLDRGITMSDKEGDFVIYNKKMERLAGYSKEDANNAPFFLEYIYPDPADRDFTVHDIEQLEEDIDHHYVDTTITNKGGEKVYLHVRSSVVKWNNRDYFLSAFKEDDKAVE
ncbi:PAS domain S-box protein [Flammeovirgaceae bacterium SG7u.111]|nr:PAS domain S-box protein [Flammeovirgaceae bacterium SG7u.132]WPO35004.1 PAS domain S-box protein [Flammeovirgaceae bacterium SG7u.111]